MSLSFIVAIFHGDESLARHSLIFRGLIPVLSAGSTKASYSEATEEAILFALQYAKDKGLCKAEDVVVALHKVGSASVIKLLTVK
ncbi:hypothetical protein AMTR_s00024p00105830 [Amborella trichopoda]|uniref:Pyruvate kinase C-terminal domain-containing protein n=1 Tax=Amborella trichopoda TaxID=13333 RepID=W1PT75_AMBTC|nr:hypothetical protein AMTR_s00024p00105830 [Amborella trichopoda]